MPTLTFTSPDPSGNVTCTGYIPDFPGDKPIGSLVINDDGAGHPVTQLTAGAFSNCPGISSITMNNLLNFTGPVPGESTFANCVGLVVVNMPSFQTFSGYENTFSGCANLSVVNMPSLQSLEVGTFIECLGIVLFDNINLGTTITSYPENTFGFCTNIVNVNVPKNVTNIGKGAFAGCTSLTTFISNGVTTFGDSALNSCTALENVYIGTNTAPTAGTDVFANNPNPNLKIYYKTGSTGWNPTYSNNNVATQVVAPPVITEPLYVDSSQGFETFLRLNASSSIVPPTSLLYTFYKNGVEISSYPDNFYLVQNPIDGDTYYCIVKDVLGQTVQSNTVTLQDTVGPVQQASFNAQSESILLTWSDPASTTPPSNGKFTYQFMVKIANGPPSSFITWGSSNTKGTYSTTVTGLDSGLEYQVTIRAFKPSNPAVYSLRVSSPISPLPAGQTAQVQEQGITAESIVETASAGVPLSLLNINTIVTADFDASISAGTVDIDQEAMAGVRNTISQQGGTLAGAFQLTANTLTGQAPPSSVELEIDTTNTIPERVARDASVGVTNVVLASLGIANTYNRLPSSFKYDPITKQSQVIARATGFSIFVIYYEPVASNTTKSRLVTVNQSYNNALWNEQDRTEQKQSYTLANGFYRQTLDSSTLTQIRQANTVIVADPVNALITSKCCYEVPGKIIPQ
jgi:hypothetical protein